MNAGKVARWGDVEIDFTAGELRRAGQVVAVEPQVFELISYLASRPGTLVSRDELIEAVWGGRIVSDSAISSRINAARAALGDDGKAQRIIKTVPRRGFRFAPEKAPSPVRSPDARPSVAVLPFDNLSNDPEQRFLCDGIADDIITDLSRYGELFVIARHTSFAYREGGRDRADIATDLGVSYVVEGGVRRAGDRVRVSAQLVDAKAGTQVWADRFDREIADIFAMQDAIAGVIVNRLVGEASRRHYRRLLRGGDLAATAYDHALKAMELVWRVSEADNLAARAEAEMAIAIDPDFARPIAVIAWTYATEGSNRWSDDPEVSFAQGLKAARRAIAADAREPWGHAALGFSEIFANRAHDRGLASLRRAVELNPSNAHFRFMLGWALTYSGRPAEAEDEIRYGLRLNPLCPPLYFAFLGRSLFHQRKFEAAITVLERHVDGAPEHANGLALAAACYAAMDRRDDAEQTVRVLESISPSFTVAYTRDAAPYARPEDTELYCDMLLKAGLRP